VKEIPLIVEVALQSYVEHYTYLWTDAGESYMVRNFSPHIIEKELGAENSEFYLLMLNDSPIGFLKINDQKALAPHSKEECLELERIYLLERVAGKGVGGEAMNFVLNVAKEKSRKVVWLKAMDSSLAVKFYKKMGFEITGSVVLDLPYMKNELRNLLVMKKQLKSLHR
jgi:GNAT superfamily N-acetyltransferase